MYCKQCFWQSMNSFWIIIEASNFKTNHQWGCWYYIQHTMVHKRDNSRQHATIKVIYPKYYKHWQYVHSGIHNTAPPSQKGGKKNTLYITEESDTLDYFDAKKDHLKITLAVFSPLYQWVNLLLWPFKVSSLYNLILYLFWPWKYEKINLKSRIL